MSDSETVSDLEKRNKFFINQLNKLLSEISHEIKNPIGTGLTASSHLRKKSQEIQSQFTSGSMTKHHLQDFIALVQESSDIIEQNLHRATDLIQNFKELTTLQARAEKTSFNLFSQLQLIKKAISPRLKKKKVNLEITGDETLDISFYPVTLFHIVDNLIINSLSHGFKNQEECVITISFSYDNNTLQIVYTDNGSGISEVDRDHIFDEYYTTDAENGSSGLGMSIIHSIITSDLGGSIKLDSPASGTQFTITVPA